MATTKAIDRLTARERAAWRPRPRPSRTDWVADRVRLPAETSSTPGRYDLDRYPYWRGVLDASDDPATETITIVTATQLGKTTLLQAVLASLPDLEPGPAMLAAPDRDACRELRDKFYRLAEATPAIARLIPPVWKRNDQWIDFGAMVCHLAWSGNTQRLSGKSCRYVLCTEVDRWKQRPHEGQTQKLIAERVKAFFQYLIVYESTPTDETSAIWELYEQSDRRRFLVPCLRCGHYQELRFFPHKSGPFAGRGGVTGLQGESGEWLGPDGARDAAHYLCEHGCRIDSADKPAMVARGVWCPAGQAVDQRGRLHGQPERSPRNAGFQLNSLYAETIDFGRIAVEYLRSRDNQSALRSFWNNWLGLRWTSKGKAPKWERVGRRLAAGHRRGVVPQNAFFLTAGADVQDDGCYFVVRAWGEGSTSWLVDWGRCGVRLGPSGEALRSSDLDQLDELVLDRVLALQQPNPAGQDKLRVRLMAIDYQGHRAWEVFEWVRSRASKGANRIRIVAGDTRVPAGQLYQMSIVETHAGSGKKYPGGLQRWAIETDAYKSEIQARYEAPLDKPGAWFLPEHVLAEGSDYLRQVCNESRRRVKNRAGREVIAWAMSDERIGNHYWDCEVYGMAAADMVTGRDWQNLLKRADRPAASRPPTPRAASSPTAAGPYGRERG